MVEFGSDFHYLPLTDSHSVGDNLFVEGKQFYANGRQAIQHLIRSNTWERIWIPEYFCYEIVEAILSTGIQVTFYADAPGHNDIAIIEKLKFKKQDVLLRMNYFGMRSFRDNSVIPVDVIEDHSHDLTGGWATKSNADWCIASIRKTLPVPEGGALWSPKQHCLPEHPVQTKENTALAERRWKAMQLKRDYLQFNSGYKDEFRKLYIETENDFEQLPLSDLTNDCKAYLARFDINSWTNQKTNNWKMLSKIQSIRLQILYPEHNECNVFSFVFLLNSEHERNNVRQYLIENKIYPVILWKVPEGKNNYVIDFSQRMLSVPCDARYDLSDIIKMKEILENALRQTVV